MTELSDCSGQINIIRHTDQLNLVGPTVVAFCWAYYCCCVSGSKEWRFADKKDFTSQQSTRDDIEFHSSASLTAERDEVLSRPVWRQHVRRKSMDTEFNSSTL